MTQPLFLRLMKPAALLMLMAPAAIHATNIGADPPNRCTKCARAAVGQHADTSSVMSRTEGNLSEQVRVATTRSSAGSTVDIVPIYNSYNADGSRASLDTVMGYGWTHSYNIFLFTQFGAMFRYDGQGRVTKFGLGPGGTYITANGYFETLVKTSSTTFKLTQKDQTVYTFATVSGTPFIVAGPVWRLTSIVDRNGNTTTLTYAAGNLTGVTDTYGRTTTFAYNAQNQISSVTDPAGRVTTFQYDSTGHKLTQITDPNGNSVQYSYNTLYQPTSKVDKAGRTFTYTYSANEPAAVNDSMGTSPGALSNPGHFATNQSMLASAVTRTYIPATTTETDGRGNTWTYQYDSNGYLLQATAPDGSATSYTYDPATLMTASTTDADGHTTSYQYNSQGDMIQTTDALGHVTTYTYESTWNMMTSMTDPRGRVTTYTYDGNGNRVQETDPLGQTKKWTYDSHGNVLSATDKDNNTTTYQYDSAGDLIKTTDPLGNITSHAYDAVGNMISTTDANGHATTYQYDGLNRLIKETDALGHSTQTFYDGEGNRTSVIDRNGHTTSYQYDQRQRLIKTTDALGNAETYQYDGDDNRISSTDRDSHTTTYSYDLQDRLSGVTDALSNTTATAYDGVGNILTQTDANGHTTTYTYDSLNRKATMTDAVGDVTHYQYDAGVPQSSLPACPNCGATPGSSEIAEQTDANGKVTYFKYDALDRMIYIVRKVGSTADTVTPADAVTTNTYDAVGNQLAYTEPDGNTTTYQYDADNRKIRDTNAAGDVTVTVYDGVNNVISTTMPNLDVTTNTYDALNRLTQMNDSAGLVATYTYDSEGNRLTVADGNGNVTSYAYDAINRVMTTTDPLGKTTTTQYDAVGNPLKSTDRNGNVTTYVYDAVNRRVSTTDALGDVTQSAYDHVGNLISVTDANSNSTLYTYDAINRLTIETSADGKSRTLAYDGVGNVLTRTDQIGQVTHYTYNDLYFLTGRTYPSAVNDSFTYDLSGRVLTTQRGSWGTTFTYDGADRVTQAVQNGHTIGYSYNIPGRTRTLTYPGGRIITENTDARNRMDHINDTTPTPLIVQYTYDAGDRVVSRAYRNGTTAAFTYNNDNWTTSLQHTMSSTTIAGFNYAYDNEGNKLYEQKLHDPTHSEAYIYDAIYRLVNYSVGTLVGSTVPVPSTQTSYNLDPLGNWKSKTTNSVTQTRTHNSVNELVQINSTNLTYDGDGNVLNDGTYSYTYDEENRLLQVTLISGPQVVGTYQYDALSRRVQKIANPTGTPVTMQYFYDGARAIEEQDGIGNTLATYVFGNYVDEVLTMNRAGNVYYYHQNALQSVGAITNSSASPVERYSYDAYGFVTVTDGLFNPIAQNAWGTPHSAIGNPYTFTGRQLDEEAGLYYYRARMYDSAKGRFLQRDPLEMQGDFAGSPNLYAYVLDAPTVLLDPSGMEEIGSTDYGSFDLVQKNSNNKNWKNGKLVDDPGWYQSDVTIKFTPNKDKVCCTEISFIQSARTIDATTLLPTSGSSAEHKKRMVPTKPDAKWSEETGGFLIDAKKGSKVGWYGYSDAETRNVNLLTPGAAPDDYAIAKLRDAPGWNRANTRFEFETCAVCKTGKDVGKVYGCLNWGFMADKDKKLTNYVPLIHKEPAPWWKAAVKKWNEQKDLTKLDITGIE